MDSKDQNEARSAFEDQDALLNGEYSGLLSIECKDFLKECLQREPQHRFDAQSLLSLDWVRHLEQEKAPLIAGQKHVKDNLAQKIRTNIAAIKFASVNEWNLLRSLISYNCLEEELTTIEEAFVAVDIHEQDGRVSYDEVVTLAKESKLFTDLTATPQDSETPGDEEQETTVSLQDLEGLFEQVDLNKNGYLEAYEFLLIAGDREIIFSEENMKKLYN